MRLYINAKTNISDLNIDYIEVLLQSGEQVSLNWDWSDYCREKGYFTARFKGVYFGEEYANGRIEDLKSITIREIGYYTEGESGEDVQLEIEKIEVDDYNRVCELQISYSEDFSLYYTG